MNNPTAGHPTAPTRYRPTRRPQTAQRQPTSSGRSIYYFLFRRAIARFNLATPGRLDDVVAHDDEERPATSPAASSTVAAGPAKLVAGKYDPAAILDAVGGPGNVESLDNCVTRLRMVVGDAGLLDEDRLKKLGAVGVIKLDAHNVQVVIGPQVQAVKDAMAELIPSE